jgi:hypothetical protein
MGRGESWIAWKNLSRSASDFSTSALSTPGGSPTSGKGVMEMSMAGASLDPPLLRSTTERITAAFTGVVRMVHLTPRAAKSAAMSAAGMRWPGARKGKKRMCTGCCSSLTAMAAWKAE